LRSFFIDEEKIMGFHKDQNEANMHEPKHVQSAVAGAADIGKVIVAKGDGTSELRKLALADLTGVDIAYGTLAVSNNTTAIAKTAAVDGTLETNTDYTQITGVWDATPHGLLNGITQQVNSLTVTNTGVYEIAVWAGMASSTISTAVAVKFAVNGVISLVRRPKTFMRNTGEVQNMAASGILSLTAGDVVTLWFASSTTANITIEDMLLSLIILEKL
jgi:hypothetical protein